MQQMATLVLCITVMLNFLDLCSYFHIVSVVRFALGLGDFESYIVFHFSHHVFNVQGDFCPLSLPFEEDSVLVS